MDIFKKHNVKVAGSGPPMMFAHGFGCDQNMWRLVTPAFEQDHKVVLFDYVGHGRSDLSAYDPAKYSSLHGFADDVLEICAKLDLHDVVFVGHSVSAIVGIMAAIREPRRFKALILIGPSACYIDAGDYTGGFSRASIEELLDFLDNNYLGWSSAMAPAIMGNPDRPELATELANSFCRTDPQVARQFARVTFLSDNRADLPKLKVPALILQCSQDIIAPTCVGEYIHQNIADSQLRVLKATGHCPHLSSPRETIGAMREYLSSLKDAESTRPARGGS